MIRRASLNLLVAATLGYLALCAWLYAAQDSMLYYPTAEVAASDAEVLRLANGPATLKVWQLGDGPDGVIYFGGNGEDVARNINNFRGMLPDATIYLVNYRGYGGSSGEPGEAAFIDDAAFLFDHLAGRHRSISAIGRSLGTGVATWLAANRPVDKLVLVTPYDSIEDIAAAVYPYMPVSLLLRDKFRTIDLVPNVSAPVLVLMAESDQIVPHANTLRLIGTFPHGQVRVRMLRGTNHRTISSAPEYVELIGQFLHAADTPRDAINPSSLRTST